MAEFQVVMKQARRMCKSYKSRCERCVFGQSDGCPFHFFRSYMKSFDFSEVERIVMDWAAKHPEPRYPNWNEVWRQLFPNASNAPCPLYCVPAHMVKEYCSAPRKCAICRSQPIPADIAEKLGIKSIGGNAK